MTQKNTIDTEVFCNRVTDCFQSEHPINIEAETYFKKLSSWDSLTALLVIDMISDTYKVTLNGDDIRQCDSIQDLIDLIEKKHG